MASKLSQEKSSATRTGVTHEEWLKRRANGQLWCYCCREWKKAEEFSKDAGRANGRHAACKQCSSYKATASVYGIPLEQARKMRTGTLACEICGQTKKLEVDHCHSTGAVRGMLCGRCNKAIGMFGDSPELIKKALAYIERGTSGL